MARHDTFGPLLLEVLRTTEEPLTLPQAAELAGSSVKRAYAWADKNRGLLVAMSHKGMNGGATYMTRDNPNRKTRTEPMGEMVGGNGGGSDGDGVARLGVGTGFTVVDMGLRAGRVELELMTETGETIRVTVNGDGLAAVG